METSRSVHPSDVFLMGRQSSCIIWCTGGILNSDSRPPCMAVNEILDAEVDAVVVTGLLALREASTAATSDPITAAELCLSCSG